MPTPDQIAAVFDFERVFELAAKALLTANNIKAFTSQMIVTSGSADGDAALVAQGWDIINFQKDRPRAELIFTPGAGQKQPRVAVFNGNEFPVETAWKGQYKIDLITGADMRIHAAFRTMVRFVMHTQLLTINGPYLDLHQIQSFHADNGTSPVMKPEDGVFQTTMLFEIDFGILDAAWATLAV